jgi:hypothetical protein
MCNELILPIVSFDQIYSFDREALVKSIPRPEKATEKDFAATAHVPIPGHEVVPVF